MRYLFASMCLVFVLGVVACEEGVSTIPTCTGNETCTSQVQTDCRGDTIVLTCSAEGYECKMACVNACDAGGYDGYTGDCKYDSEKGREVCFCLE